MIIFDHASAPQSKPLDGQGRGGLGTAFSFADIESQEADLEGIPVRVATPRMLYRMKRSTFEEAADAMLLRPPVALTATRMRALFGLSARIAPRAAPSRASPALRNDDRHAPRPARQAEAARE